jgi:hypothetical protein
MYSGLGAAATAIGARMAINGVAAGLVADQSGRVTIWRGIQKLYTNPLGGSPLLGAFYYVAQGAGTQPTAGLLVSGAFEGGIAFGSAAEATFHVGMCR